MSTMSTHTLRTAAVVAAAAVALLTTATGAWAAPAGSDAPDGGTPSAQSARSTQVTVANGTKMTMYRSYTELAHGVWDDATPPEQIAGGATVSWGSHSSGFMTGTEGYAVYDLGTAGAATIRWNNPFAGGNSYSCSVPDGYTCSRSGGGGNNATVTFTIGGGRDAKRAASADAQGRPPSAAAQRSTHVTLQNRTEEQMDRTSSSLKHGTWSHNMLPPDVVYPMSNSAWQSESNGFMTGTEGTAVYNMYAVGNVSISWNNPYVGSNDYSCDVPTGYTCERDGGGGDNAQVTFTVRKA
ncbi:Crystal protein ET79 [Streptomyces bambusae]|uniref:Crystal protein ET79 n=1 Tax=Streptomyces bambusae TaxID=1550616 RepID=A0ABS6Z5B3_9ACTN|nr:Crystal protein ET79 [Streptomyces bambusae]MBW5481926.1 Crystal protein ET79 [Streptomyces bambusae]